MKKTNRSLSRLAATHSSDSWKRLLKIATVSKTLGTLSFLILGVSTAVAGSGRPAAVEDQILIKMKSHMSEKAEEALFAVHGGKVVDSIPQIAVRVLKVPAANRDRVLEALRHNPNIEFAEPNTIATAGGLTNDPYVTNNQQWHLSKIQAIQAWDITPGNASTVVAIVDTGVASNHPDLVGKLLPGYNFNANNTDTSDSSGHGTAVAGTAAAQGNNGQGVAGVAWGNSILPVKISDSTSYATYANMAKALTYAVDQGARVINISFYGSTSSSTLQSAADYVWNRNGIIFACAGNTGTNSPQYPAACNTVIAVSDINSADTLSPSSTYGSFISLSAPGTNILTTNSDGGYGGWSGTSFASPVAAGVATLVVAANPQLSNASIVNILRNNSDDLGAAGFDTSYGHGRVNAYRAVVAAGVAPADSTAPTVAITSPSSGSTVSGTVNVPITSSDAVGVTKVEFYLDGGLAASSTQPSGTFTWDTLGSSNGAHTLRALAYDVAGNVGSSANVGVNVQNNVAVITDTVAPTALITSPTVGTSVPRNLKVSTSTTDNVRVVRVELYFDGSLAASSSTSSATFSLSTGKWARGSHTLQLLAYDAAGNAGSSAKVAISK
jgi:subtilisin family serine protease